MQKEEKIQRKEAIEKKEMTVMAISIKKLDEKHDVARYLVKGASPSFINMIRRGIMLHTPCLAVEKVSIYENDSVMFDEMLAHRLGMMPIKMDKTYKMGDKVKLVVEKEGPCTVYAKDIKSTDPKAEVADKNILITKLEKDQRLRLEMEAEVNTGETHVKWQPAIVSYKEVPELVVSKDCNQCRDCIKICPEGILEVKGKTIAFTDPNACSLCRACVDACGKGAIKLVYNKNEYILIIESAGGMSPKEIISSTVKAMLEKNKEIGKALAKAK